MRKLHTDEPTKHDKMEQFKISVEVSFSKETLETLKQVATAAIMTTLSKNDVESAKDIIAQAQYEEEKKEQAEAAAAEAPQEEAPQEQEPQPEWYEVTDQELAQATKNAVQRVKAKHQSPTFIRSEIFKKYGINQSIECPKESRPELLKELEAIAREEE